MTTPNPSPTPPDQSQDAKIMSVLRDIVVVDENHRLDVVEGGLAKIAECFAPDQSAQGGGAKMKLAGSLHSTATDIWERAFQEYCDGKGGQTAHERAIHALEIAFADLLEREERELAAAKQELHIRNAELKDVCAKLDAAKQEVEGAQRFIREEYGPLLSREQTAREQLAVLRGHYERSETLLKSAVKEREMNLVALGLSADSEATVPDEITALRAQLARQQGQRNEGEGWAERALREVRFLADDFKRKESEIPLYLRIEISTRLGAIERHIQHAPSRPATGNDKDRAP